MVYVVVLVVSALMFVLKYIKISGKPDHVYVLTIKVQGSMEYIGLFNELFQRYARSTKLLRIKSMSSDQTCELKYELRFAERGFPLGLFDELLSMDEVLNLNYSAGEEWE